MSRYLEGRTSQIGGKVARDDTMESKEQMSGEMDTLPPKQEGMPQSQLWMQIHVL